MRGVVFVEERRHGGLRSKDEEVWVSAEGSPPCIMGKSSPPSTL